MKTVIDTDSKIKPLQRAFQQQNAIFLYSHDNLCIFTNDELETVCYICKQCLSHTSLLKCIPHHLTALTSIVWSI